MMFEDVSIGFGPWSHGAFERFEVFERFGVICRQPEGRLCPRR